MKVTITGATGLVGSNLALELIRQGHEVRCTRRATSRIEHLEGEPIEWVEADLADVHALTRPSRAGARSSTARRRWPCTPPPPPR